MGTREFTTERLSEEHVINWKIKNFTELLDAKIPNNKTICLKFVAGIESLKQSSTWKVELRFTTAKQIGFHLKLHKSYKRGKNVYARYCASIKNSSSRLTARKSTGLREYTGRGSSWGFAKFVTFDKLKADGALINDTLIIQIKMIIYGDDTVRETTPTCTQTSLRENSLNHFKKLLQTGQCSDFVIRVKKELDSNEYIEKKVHRAFLSCQSPVFEAMMGSQMLEKETGVVTIKDLTPKGLDVLLEFIYTGNLPDDWKLVPEEILNAAEKYNLPLLKEYIDEKLHLVCTPENASTIYNSAKRLGLSKASKNILEYIKSNIEDVLEIM